MPIINNCHVIPFMNIYTSTKQDLSLEEVLNLSIVMFCVGAQPGARVSGFGPVNFRHASQKDSQGPQLHVSLQVQHNETRHSLSRVKHGLILRPQNLKTFQFPHHRLLTNLHFVHLSNLTFLRENI